MKGTFMAGEKNEHSKEIKSAAIFQIIIMHFS